MRPPKFPSGCGPPVKIQMRISSEHEACMRALGRGFVTRGIQSAIEEHIEQQPKLKNLLLALRRYKKDHPEHDWDLLEVDRNYHEAIDKK